PATAESSAPAPAAPLPAAPLPAEAEPTAEIRVDRTAAQTAEAAVATAVPPANEPLVDVPRVQTEPAGGDSRMSLVWLGGAGLLLMLGLLLFGRRIGSRFGST